MQVVLVPVLFVLASFIQAGVALTCYNCSFVEGTSADATINDKLNVIKKYNDVNCKLNGELYKKATGLKTIPCITGGCAKYYADATITDSKGLTTTIKQWTRACGVAIDQCSGDFSAYAAAMKIAMKAQDVRMSGTVCVCKGEKCNAASHVTLAATCMFLAGILYMFL